MKLSRTMLLAAALCASAALFASESGSVNIDAQIEEIKKAPPSQRRELMNRFKMELAHMNQQQRMEAIRQLRASMQPRMRNGAEQGHGMMSPPMRQIVDTDQMRQTQHMGHMEMMGQHQGEEQFMHEHPEFRPYTPDHVTPPFSPGAGSGSTPPGTPGASNPASGAVPGAGSVPSGNPGSANPVSGTAPGAGSGTHRPSTPLPFSVRK
ncbi:hypothetical protein [Hydrogenimonas sp. SS33]|uniref:hypothetical protein n=1 Tax=Hydrogenimonas leucolamina TaxID=2954236 RepID=UPI00336C0A48